MVRVKSIVAILLTLVASSRRRGKSISTLRMRRKLGTVHFATSCNEVAKKEFKPSGRPAAFFPVQPRK